MRQETMATDPSRQRRNGAVALRELIGGVIDPLTAKRGFATAELFAAWPDIAGPIHANWTAPEKIVWPKGPAAGKGAMGILHLRVDGRREIFVQHEIPQIIERINRFLGYAAVGQVRLVQGPVTQARPVPPAAQELAPGKEAALAAQLSDVADERLKEALSRLGREVLARQK